MAGPPAHVLDRVPDASALQQFAEDNEPPFRIGYRRGEETAEEEFAHVRTAFGNGRAELVYEDGRHVTVDVAGEVERAEVSR